MSAESNRGQINPNFGNPEQKPKDPRIEEIRWKLSEFSRFLADPSLIGLSGIGIKPTAYVGFGDAEKLPYVRLYRNDYTREDYVSPNLPRQIQEHERILPLEIIRTDLSVIPL